MNETGASLLEVLIALLLLSTALTAMQHLTLSTLRLTQSRTREFNLELGKHREPVHTEHCSTVVEHPITVYQCKPTPHITRTFISYE